ncbi:HigA family addiction module antitoxin [Demequina pelophila]|uniref:HigA family addiction module antitoxin n=1 Tax=Demequina pelophila TaxID=1638984 RepID=UPI0007858B79|nr:HigA family addiction module antitoxin [Demequina pelophila]
MANIADDDYFEIDLVTPGEMLRVEVLEPLGITAYRLAKATGMTQTRVAEIISGKRRITADTAQRLAHVLGGSAQSWLGLQATYDLLVAERENGDVYRRLEVLAGPSAA